MSVERHGRRDSSRAGCACGIKESGAPDLAIVATDDRAPVRGGRRVHDRTSRRPRRCRSSRAHLADGRAAAVVLNSGNANAATGEPGRRDARRMCELTAEGLGIAPADVLVCSTGLIGIPMPMDAARGGHPEAVRAGVERRRRCRRGAGDHDHRHRAEGSRRDASARRPSAGWRRARRCSRPRWRRCSRSSRPMPPSSRAALQRALAAAVVGVVRLPERRRRAARPTTPCSCSPTAGRAPVDDRTRSPTRSPRCAASLAEQMARDAEGATKFVRVRVVGARTDADARMAARGVANSQLVQCSLNGDDPYWGRVLSELGASGAFLDPERVDISYSGVTVCRDGIACDARRGGARGARWPQPTSRSAATCASGTARRRCSRPISRTRTSTRTGARRERKARRSSGVRAGARRGGEGARSSPRRCRTSASSPGARSSSSTAATRWRTPSSPTSSRPTSCSCDSSG